MQRNKRVCNVIYLAAVAVSNSMDYVVTIMCARYSREAGTGSVA